jgi:hypothetical protein
MAIVHARPWQRYLICAVMIVGGAALVALGHIVGVVLAALGGLAMWRMNQYRIRSRKEDGLCVTNEAS